MEKSLIRNSCISRDLVKAIKDIGLDSKFSPSGEILFKEISSFYERDKKANKVDLEFIRHKLDKGKHKDLLLAVISGVEDDSSLSPDNWRGELHRAELEDVQARLAQALLDPQGKINNINALLDERNEILQKVDQDEAEQEEVYNAATVEDVLARVDQSVRVGLRPAGLSAHLGGGIHRPCHVVLFARPDAGKTTFVINQIVGFTEQGLKVLYYGNEDAPQVILFRVLQAYTGATETQIRHHPARATEVATGKGYAKLYLHFTDAGSLRGAETIAERVQADVIILDQLRNLKSAVKDNRVLELEALAREARAIGKRQDCVVISVTQAGDSGENKLVLGQGDVDYSNTGIQGTADLMIGVGVDERHREQGNRVLSFPKNKINGNREPYMIKMQEQICTITD